MDDRPKRKAKRSQETLPGHYERGPVAGKDFASAVVIGALAMVFMVFESFMKTSEPKLIVPVDRDAISVPASRL